MAYAQVPTITWDRTTPRDGLLFAAEFARLYDVIANYIVANGGSAPPKTMKSMSDLIDTINSGTLTISGAKTFSGSVVLPQTTTPAQTADGSIVWDSDSDLLTVGDGSSRKTMVDTSQNQTIAGTKTFSSKITGSISGNCDGNAGTVTNGVYTTGDQSIASTKTFSGAIILPKSTTPAQTADGSIVWDSDSDLLTVGDGSSRKTMVDTSQNQTIAGTKTFSSTIVGNVQGNVTGNVTGDITGHAHAIAETGSGAGIMRWKIIEIGDWNMDATAQKFVTHGVTREKIRSIYITIRGDSDGDYYPLNYIEISSGVTQGKWFLPIGSPTFIEMQRYGGGIFDSTNFDSTSYNRGYITIGYID